MGGYGLFGVIVDLDVEMTPNVLLQRSGSQMPGDAFAEPFLAAIENDPHTLMAYGRLSVARATFFHEALLTTYSAASPQPSPLPAASSVGAMNWISSDLSRLQIGSEAAKSVGCHAETKLTPNVSSPLATR